MNRLRCNGFLLAGIVFVLGASSALADPAPARGSHAGQISGPLAEVLSRFDEVQDSIRTLSAQFTETTVNHLLKEPMVARGRLYMTKPDSVLWEYTAPESMRFVISKNEYVGYFPVRKRAERRNIRRWSENIFRFFGLGQASAELRKFYDIRLDESDTSMRNAYLLILDPKKRRVRKRVEDVRLWVDRSSLLPVKLEYRDKAGNARVIRFHGVQVNPDLAASLYRVNIPSDVTVTTGFTGLGGFGSTR